MTDPADYLNERPTQHEVADAVHRMRHVRHRNSDLLLELWKHTLARTTHAPLTRLKLLYLEHCTTGETFAAFARRYGYDVDTAGHARAQQQQPQQQENTP